MKQPALMVHRTLLDRLDFGALWFQLQLDGIYIYT